MDEDKFVQSDGKEGKVFEDCDNSVRESEESCSSSGMRSHRVATFHSGLFFFPKGLDSRGNRCLVGSGRPVSSIVKLQGNVQVLSRPWVQRRTSA